MELKLKASSDSTKLFCTIEIANGIGSTEYTVKRAAEALGITPLDAGRKGHLYTYSEYIRIKSWIQANIVHGMKPVKPDVQKKPRIQKSLEELRREHPLVKDDQCFNINWWPDTKPKVYEEIWGEED